MGLMRCKKQEKARGHGAPVVLTSQAAFRGARNWMGGGGKEEEDKGDSQGCSPAAEKNMNPADGGRLGTCSRRRRSGGRHATGSGKTESSHRGDRHDGAGLVRRPTAVMNSRVELRQQRRKVDVARTASQGRRSRRERGSGRRRGQLDPPVGRAIGVVR